MKSAIAVSILFHATVYFLSTHIINFSRVRYVPRQVYAVSLFSMDDARKHPDENKNTRPTPPKSPEKAEKDEEMKPPPDESQSRRKKKQVNKKPKVKKKTVPSSEVNEKTAADNQTSGASSATGGGIATGDINLDASDFPFGYYLVSIRRKIASNWNVINASGGEAAHCRVYFKINRRGGIISPTIETSSGYFLFDQAAVRAVLQAVPLPPLPGEYQEDYLGVHFSFAYEER